MRFTAGYGRKTCKAHYRSVAEAVLRDTALTGGNVFSEARAYQGYEIYEHALRKCGDCAVGGSADTRPLARPHAPAAHAIPLLRIHGLGRIRISRKAAIGQDGAISADIPADGGNNCFGRRLGRYGFSAAGDPVKYCTQRMKRLLLSYQAVTVIINENGVILALALVGMVYVRFAGKSVLADFFGG